MYLVQDLYEQHGQSLGLTLVTSEEGLKRQVRIPEAHRPGLGLAGYLKGHVVKRILVFGKVEIEYLRDLEPDLREERMKAILLEATPAVVVARGYRVPRDLRNLCQERGVPLFRSPMTTINLLNKLTQILNEEFSTTLSYHGTLVEVFGVGVLIQGDSSVGKSEAALGLVERGHRLISDDVVKVRLREGHYLEGFGAELTRHHMEIRGIGIINIAHLYGAVCVRERKSIDMTVRLEAWDDNTFYDRVGLEENCTEILGVKIPCHTVPVKPGRDVVLLLETLALNHRLKKMGYHSAREFNAKLLDMLARKQERKRVVNETGV